MAAEVASLQKGCLAHGQLSSLGLSDDQIRRALASGRLRRIHRGVYEFESSARELRREAAALLCVGPGATLTGCSVLDSHGVIPVDPRRPVDVAVVGSHRRSHTRDGVRVHRYRDLGAREVRILKGLAMTTIERALLDAADELGGTELESAVDEAVAGRLSSRTKIRETAERAHGRRGQSELLRLAQARRPSALTQGWAAKRALELIRQAKLPEPDTEVPLFGFRADFFFSEAGVVLEVDSFAYHGLIRANFNRDRRKDRVYRQHGLEVVRVTADELKDTPVLFVSDLSATIARRLEAKKAA